MFEGSTATGWVQVKLAGADGRIIARRLVRNQITDTGDAYHAAVIGRQNPAPVNGMKWGTDGRASTKNGTASTLVAYVANAAALLDTGYPRIADPTVDSTVRAYTVTWQATAGNGNPYVAGQYLREVALVTDADQPAAAPTPATTIARAIWDGPIYVATGQTLTIRWHHTHRGQ